jgi:hypothetical protein
MEVLSDRRRAGVPLTLPCRHGFYPPMSTVVRPIQLWWRTS